MSRAGDLDAFKWCRLLAGRGEPGDTWTARDFVLMAAFLAIAACAAYSFFDLVSTP